MGFRYSPKNVPVFPKCGHRGDKESFVCWRLSMNDIRRFHEMFYSSRKKTDQDTFIITYCSAGAPKRKRPKVNVRNKPKTVSLTYTVQKMDGTKVVVCRDAFLGILGVKKDRVLRVVKK